MAGLMLDDVVVEGSPVRRLDQVSVVVEDGGFVGVVGGSGSGKTTFLRAVAGLERVASGLVRIGGRDVTRATPGERDIGMVFQTPALMGHLSARRNVSFPLDVRHSDVEEIRQRVDAEARALHIEQLLEREPSQLSQGEQQMVQIARALVRVPTLLLLDEPFASLDDQLRHRMRAEIALLQAGYGVTTLMATNDPADVMALTTSLIVLDHGRLAQRGTTSHIRESPATLMAAAATGPVSLIDMTVAADATGYWLTRDDPRGGASVRIRVWSPAYGAHVGSVVAVGFRPEQVVVSDTGAVPAVVERRLPIPPGSVRCSVAGASLMAAAEHPGDLREGDSVRLRVDHLVAFDKLTERAIV
jgi:ABC-type sugar transport system ATPase subunit